MYTHEGVGLGVYADMSRRLSFSNLPSIRKISGFSDVRLELLWLIPYLLVFTTALARVERVSELCPKNM